MHTASLISVLFVLISAYTSPATPLPLECSCEDSPLSAPTMDYIHQMSKARHLTSEECAFICNPNRPTQKALDSAVSEPTTSETVEASLVTANRIEIEEIHSSAELPEGPPLYDPPIPRPLPLFDAPPPAANPPTEAFSSRGPRIVIHRPAVYAHVQSTLSPVTHGKLRPCALRIVGSLLLLLVLVVCVFEVGTMSWKYIKR